ncbi:hypothetical protein ABMA28_003878 [Loxostege sticticalis]|uniref:Peptidase S1 domain-containing protein n=1 Tax=Loxostege sticticalis TaxID=481309 RepID=A0ABD0STD9_LOXSC
MAFMKCSLLIGLLVHLTNGSPIEPQTEDFVPHIVGGVDAPDNYSPHAMALTAGYHVNSLMCGASIISECHVLTAAHCIVPLVTWTGELSTSLYGVYGSNKWESTEKRIQFSGYINHEKYDPFLFKYDIGVLFINGKLTRSEKWNIIPLNSEWIGAGHESYVTGWGRLWNWGPIPARLQLIYVKTMSGRRCAEGVAGAVPPGWGSPPVDPQTEICTEHPKGEGFGVCNGDSGSALVSLKTKTQIGVVSWGFPCARGAPDVFMRVSAFIDFLRKIVNTCKK